MIWKLNAMASLKWRCWNDEWAIFDVGSGQTHQMDSLTAATLMIVEAAPAQLTDLILQISEDFLVPSDKNLSDVLAIILTRLEDTGLIKCERQ